MKNGDRAVVHAKGQDRVNILLVDDQPAKLLSYEVILSELGENLIKAGSAREALEQLLKVDVALILLDVSMPGLGGFGVLHYLRRDGVLDQARVIMLTASASEDDVRQAIGLGATGYLAKPLDIRLLVDRVDRCMR